MDKPIITTPSGVFNFLGLPSELRNRIYQLHLSKGGGVAYRHWNHPLLRNSYDDPINIPFVGINLLRVCRQIYLEAIKYVYTDRTWDLGCDHSCARRLSHMPSGTVEKIQHLKLIAPVDLQDPTPSVRSFTMGDLTKMKSLQTVDVWVAGGSSETSEIGATYFDSPHLVGMVCHILSHIPVHVEIIWSSPIRESVFMEQISRECYDEIQGELDAALEHIAHKFAAIKGRNYMTST